MEVLSKRPAGRHLSTYEFIARLGRGGSLNQFLQSQMNGYAVIAVIFGLFSVFQTLSRRGRLWIQKYLTSTVYLKQDDESFEMLTAWIHARELDGLSRTLMARVSPKRRDPRISRYAAKPDRNKDIQYSPWEGSFVFWYKGRPISYQTIVKTDRDVQVALTCLGRSSHILKTLLSESRDLYLAQTKHKTGIFKHRGEVWRKSGEKSSRPLSTIIVPQSEKDALIKDIETFLDEDTKKWYNDHAIPYQRGYLLCGPPGTGKSSMSLSIAGHFGMDIYIVNLTSGGDQNLEELFFHLPDKCLVLLEDVDVAGLSRRPTAASSPDPPKPSTGRVAAAPSLGGVTLSGLLNTLDGVSSQSGRVLVMTTNYASDLDQALTRPGRIDMKVEFQLADEDIIGRMFRFVYGPSEDKDSEKTEATYTEDQVARFVSLVPASSFSQAELLSHLLRWRDDPEEAISNATAWVDYMRQAKHEASPKAGIQGASSSPEGVAVPPRQLGS